MRARPVEGDVCVELALERGRVTNTCPQSRLTAVQSVARGRPSLAAESQRVVSGPIGMDEDDVRGSQGAHERRERRHMTVRCVVGQRVVFERHDGIDVRFREATRSPGNP